MNHAFTVTLNGKNFPTIAASSIDALWIATAYLAREQNVPLDEVILRIAIVRPNAEKALH